MNISEVLYALPSATISGEDGRTVTVQGPLPSTYLTSIQEVLRRLFTNITSPSATLASGGSAGCVALTGAGLPSGINGRFMGAPFALSHLGSLSGQPTSLVSTASFQVRRVLVTLTMSALSTVTSSLALTGGGLGFVYGSAVKTSAGAASNADASHFSAVPIPFASAGEVPLGWLQIPNSFTTSGGLANSMMKIDWRAIQGLDFSAIMPTVQQI